MYALSGFSSLLRTQRGKFKFLIPYFRALDGSNASYAQELSPELCVLEMCPFTPDDYENLLWFGTDHLIELGKPGILAFQKACGEIIVDRASSMLESLRTMNIFEGDGVAFALDATFLTGDQARYELAARLADEKLGLSRQNKNWLERELSSAAELFGRGQQIGPHNPPPVAPPDPIPPNEDDAIAAKIARLNEYLKELNVANRHEKKRIIIQNIADLGAPSENLLEAAHGIVKINSYSPRVLEAVFSILPPSMSKDDGDKFVLNCTTDRWEEVQKHAFHAALERLTGSRKMDFIISSMSSPELCSLALQAFLDDDDTDIRNARDVLISFGVYPQLTEDLLQVLSRYPFLVRRMKEGRSFIDEDALDPAIAKLVDPRRDYRSEVTRTRNRLLEYLFSPAPALPDRNERGLAGRVFAQVITGRWDRKHYLKALDRVIQIDAIFGSLNKFTIKDLQDRDLSILFIDWYIKKCNIEAAEFITEVVLGHPSSASKAFARAIVAARDQYIDLKKPIDFNVTMRLLPRSLVEDCGRVIAQLRRITSDNK